MGREQRGDGGRVLLYITPDLPYVKEHIKPLDEMKKDFYFHNETKV